MTFDPLALQFYVNANWNVRSDDPSSIASCLRNYLTRLSAVDPLLAGWQLGRMWVPYRSLRDDIETLLRCDVNETDAGEPDPKLGYSLMGLSSGQRQRFRFLGNAGRVYEWPLANDLTFDTDNDGPADTGIVTYPMIKGVVLATIAAWRPDFCAAYSTDLEPDHTEGRYRKAWMTYVPPVHANRIDLVGVPFSETTPDGGLLLSATDKTFDAFDPAHLAGAQRLHEATRHLNATIPNYLDEDDP